MDLNIAFLQLLPGKTQEENLEKGLQACREAKERGADIALFPEIWNIGYDIDQEPETLRKLAVSVDSPFVTVFQELAKELQMAIGITFLESYHPAPRNTICLFDMYGKPVLRYAKVHTCAFDVEARLTPGDTFYVKTLQTAKGPIKIGAMICYDREFPESARIMMLKGAELILVPNACPMEINRLAQLRGRTYENMLAIATCNYPAPHPDCNGHSTLFDGVVYLPDEPGSRDTCVLETPEEEGIYLATLNLSMLRSYREEERPGAWRHPEKYGILTDTEIAYPFCP